MPDQSNTARLHEAANARADQCVEFGSKLIERGMRVKLGNSGREAWQELQKIFFIDLTILQEAEYSARVSNVFLP